MVKENFDKFSFGKFSEEEVDLAAMSSARNRNINIKIEWAKLWIKYFSKHTAFPTWAPFKVICLYTAWVVFNSNRRERWGITESEWESDAKKILTQAQIMYNGGEYSNATALRSLGIRNGI